MRQGLQLDYMYIHIGWSKHRLGMPGMPMGSCDRCEFPPVFKRHWQSPCTLPLGLCKETVKQSPSVVYSGCCGKGQAGLRTQYHLIPPASRAIQIGQAEWLCKTHQIARNLTHYVLNCLGETWNIYLHFLSFLNIEMAEVVEIFLSRRQWPIHSVHGYM